MDGLSLCSGIGGIDLGLRRAVPGYRTVCHVEVDPSAQDVLLARMADGVLDRAPIWGDLKRFDARPWRGRVDLVHGGYPCPPFSTVGKRRGADDPQHLWPDVARVVRECEPEWCLFENVAGHFSLGAREVVADLDALGFRVAHGFFTAREVGAPHERERLFILAHAGALGLHPLLRGAGDVAGPRGGRAGVPRESTERAAAGGAAVGYPRSWPPGPLDAAWRDVVALDADLSPRTTEGKLNPGFVEWLMGFPLGWTHGVPRNARLAALGNAVVPAVAALAWRELRDELSARAGPYWRVPEPSRAG